MGIQSYLTKSMGHLRRLTRASNLLSSELLCDTIWGATLYTWLVKVLQRGFIGIVAVDHLDEFAPEIGVTR